MKSMQFFLTFFSIIAATAVWAQAPEKPGAPASVARSPAKPAAKDTGDIQERFDTMMKAAQSAAEAKKHKVAYDLLVAFEPQLLKADPDYGEKVMWAYWFDFKRFNAYELGNKDEAYRTCERALKALAGGGGWAYLESHNVVRSAQRGCHNMLAWKIQDSAKTAKDLEPAINHIESCFDTKAPIEDADVHDLFFQTRAMIYLKSLRWGEKSAERSLHETLAEAQKRELDLFDEFVAGKDEAELKKIMQSTAYLAYKKSHKWSRD
jgi:hypothetical protein